MPVIGNACRRFLAFPVPISCFNIFVDVSRVFCNLLFLVQSLVVWFSKNTLLQTQFCDYQAISDKLIIQQTRQTHHSPCHQKPRTIKKCKLVPTDWKSGYRKIKKPIWTIWRRRTLRHTLLFLPFWINRERTPLIWLRWPPPLEFSKLRWQLLLLAKPARHCWHDLTHRSSRIKLLLKTRCKRMRSRTELWSVHLHRKILAVMNCQWKWQR